MIQISNEDAAFILDELNKRAEHQMAAYNGIDPDLQGVINDLDAQLNPVQEETQEAPAAAVAAFMADEPHEQFDEDATESSEEEPEAPSA